MDFEEVIEKFRTKEYDINRWNFCIGGKVAYIMGEGSEQCLASKRFNTADEIRELYTSIGVKFILPI